MALRTNFGFKEMAIRSWDRNKKRLSDITFILTVLDEDKAFRKVFSQ
jgi:hypothetical protein